MSAKKSSFPNKMDFGFSTHFGHSRRRISHLLGYFMLIFDWNFPLIIIYDFRLKVENRFCEEGSQRNHFPRQIKLILVLNRAFWLTEKALFPRWKLGIERDRFLKFHIKVLYNSHLQLGSRFLTDQY